VTRAGKALIGLTALAFLCSSAAGGAAPTDPAPSIADQLLARRAQLDLSEQQVASLRAMSNRSSHTLQVLTERLRASEATTTEAATHDTKVLLQQIGRLRVMSGRDALLVLTTTQRRHWVQLRAERTP
jgi:hypothetical protein